MCAHKFKVACFEAKTIISTFENKKIILHAEFQNLNISNSKLKAQQTGY